MKLTQVQLEHIKNIVVILIILFFSIGFYIGATKAEINIIEPSNDNSIITSDFTATAYINDSNIAQAQVRITGYQWVNLEQATSTVWSYSYKIASFSNGEYVISAKYRKNGDVNWIYVNSTTLFTIQKPIPQLGQVDFTVKDKYGAILTDVLVNPSGNLTNSNGLVHVGDQPLNTAINYTFSKTGYINSYQLVTFQNNTLLPIPIKLSRIGSDKKTFKISGYDDALEAGSLFYLKVRDYDTDEPVDGANVIIRQGEVVKSIPGNTTNGGWRTVTFANAGQFQLMVTKVGYIDWETSIFVFAPKVTATPSPTPTPTLTPTPIPTPVLKPCADFGVSVTDDDCRKLLLKQEETERASIQNTTTTQQQQPQEPPKKDNFPYALFIGGGVLITGFVVYKTRQNKKPHTQPIIDPNEPDTLEHFVPEIKRMEKVSCPHNCGWFREIEQDAATEPIIDAMIKTHLEEFHSPNAKKIIVGCDVCSWYMELPKETTSEEMKKNLTNTHMKEKHPH